MDKCNYPLSILKDMDYNTDRKEVIDMQISFILFQKLVHFFIMILLGYVLVKKHLLKANDSKIISVLVVYLVLPCAIINSFGIEFTNDKLKGLLFAAVLAVIIHIFLLIFIMIGERFWHWNAIERATVMYSNSGNMIIPLVSAILGPDYVLYSSAFMSVQMIFLWTHCSTMIAERPRMEWKKILTNINVLAIIAGLLLFFLKIRLPGIILTPITDIGNMLAPLSMIVTGMLMADAPIKKSLQNKKIYLFSAIRLVIWPAVLLLLMYASRIYTLIPDGKTLLLIVFLASITPSASTITQMAQVFDKDAPYAGILNVFTTLFCIITMPAAVILFSFLIH